jgi:excinuclease ABC subunit C
MWLIDGGETLLHLAKTLLNTHSIALPVLAIAKEKIASKAHRAKGNAHDRIWTIEHCFSLPPSDKRLQFIQRLRDEAHRFAIAYHQKKKRAHDLQMNLLESKGIGHATLKKLLATLGTFEAVYEAPREEFERILGEKMGEKIFNSLKK